ncbi:hypothetical protein Cni_G12308 [Canna indica]|uniref:Uncharacterized protein n=1 Tax=Canna indica TaxID=4628 RepID=A0AAQ3K7L5_9LILI|nr:hypothetical protein Cni_G12308 [Canna indica]
MPWRAKGAQLDPTVSVCERCSAKGSSGIGCDVGGEEERKEEEEEGEGEGGRKGGGRLRGRGRGRGRGRDDDEGDNQVVSWSLTPLSVASSSSSEEEQEEELGRARNGGGFLKRMRESVDLAVSKEQEEESDRARNDGGRARASVPVGVIVSHYAWRCGSEDAHQEPDLAGAVAGQHQLSGEHRS